MKKLNWIIIVLFLLMFPFQRLIYEAMSLPRAFLWTDEIFIVFYFIFSFPLLLYRRKIKKVASRIFFVLILLGLVGFISGAYNGNRGIVTINGTFDYLKHFLIIPVFCLFSFEESKVKRFYSLLHRLALFFCLVAFIQELGFYMNLPLERIGVPDYDVRFGILRTPSLIGSPNVFGLYTLLFFVLDFSLHRRIRWQNMVFALGSLLSVSRMVLAAFFSVIFLFVMLKKGKNAVILFVLLTAILFLVSPIFYSQTVKEIGSVGSFREYTFAKSMSIWKEHPLIGIGPGMYGGIVSFMFKSPVYGKYIFNNTWLEVFEDVLSLDQFWPQILVEMGILGAVVFVLVLLTLWRMAKYELQFQNSDFRRDMLFGLSIIPVILAIYLLGSGLNLGVFLLTYSVLYGLVLGMKNESITGR